MESIDGLLRQDNDNQRESRTSDEEALKLCHQRLDEISEIIDRLSQQVNLSDEHRTQLRGMSEILVALRATAGRAPHRMLVSIQKVRAQVDALRVLVGLDPKNAREQLIDSTYALLTNEHKIPTMVSVNVGANALTILLTFVFGVASSIWLGLAAGIALTAFGMLISILRMDRWVALPLTGEDGAPSGGVGYVRTRDVQGMYYEDGISVASGNISILTQNGLLHARLRAEHAKMIVPGSLSVGPQAKK